MAGDRFPVRFRADSLEKLCASAWRDRYQKTRRGFGDIYLMNATARTRAA